MTMEATTPRASLESSILDSSRENASSTTRTLLNTSSMLLSDFFPQLEVEAGKNASGLTCTSIPVQQHLCMHMLSNGKPKSFIGDFEQLSHINFEIANVFDNSGHHQKAVFYLLRSLKSSKQAQNGSQEAKVKFNLGKVNVKLGAFSEAITWFEEYLDFANDNQDNEGLFQGSRQLLEVYELFAKRARRKGQLCKCLELSQKSVDMAEICGDDRAKAEAKHQIGLAHQKLSQFDLALQYQTEFLEFCCSNNDEVGQSKAHSALAKTRESMGEIELAIKHLEALLEVSQHVNLETQAAACCKLGMMYNQQHNYDKALQFFETFFKLACTLKDPKLMDAARLNLGYVKNILNLDERVFTIARVR